MSDIFGGIPIFITSSTSYAEYLPWFTKQAKNWSPLVKYGTEISI